MRWGARGVIVIIRVVMVIAVLVTGIGTMLARAMFVPLGPVLELRAERSVRHAGRMLEDHLPAMVPGVDQEAQTRQ